MKTINFSIALILVCCSLASAQYVSDFDALSGGNTLSDQGGWLTDDANQSDYVGEIPGYSSTPTDYWAFHGGIIPTPNPSATTTNLWRSFTPIPNTVDITFTITTMAISGSSPSRPNQDTFGWTLSDSSANEIAEIRFIPSGGNLTINYVDHTGAGTPVYSGFIIPYNSEYQVVATISDLNSTPTFKVDFTDAFATTITVINTPLASSAADVGRVTSTWSLASTPVNFGSNAMIFENLSVVPEPGAAVLVALGLVGLAAFRMRTRKI